MSTTINGTTGINKIQDGTVVDADIASLSASKLTGSLPAIDGSSLTGVGKVIQTTEASNSTDYSWNDGSSQIVLTNNITVLEGSKVLIHYNIPISINGITAATWASMSFLYIQQNGSDLFHIEHNGFGNVNYSHRVWNESGSFLTDTLSAGTYTYGFRVDPYVTSVTCTVSRSPRKRQIILQEVIS